MKRTILAFLAAAAVVSGGFFAYYSYAADERGDSDRVIAYYFHGTFRCPTCHRIEQYSKEAIDSNFKDALSSGKLEFKVINVEEPGNKHFVNDYKLYTKSLVISQVRDGKEVRSKNLSKIWEYAVNKRKFFDYVKNEIDAFLKSS